MSERFIDPWGVVIPGGDVDEAALIGLLAVHKSGEIAPIVKVDQIWPNLYMLSIGTKTCYLTDQMKNFYIYTTS